MRVEYDQKHNIAYIGFLDSDAEDLQTLHISEALSIDLMPDGRLYGIELLNANEQLFRQDAGRLVVSNRQSGKSQAVCVFESP